jgi:hypothetical protein
LSLRQQFFEHVFLGFKLSKLGRNRRLHLGKASVPLVENGKAKEYLITQLINGHTQVRVFEDAGDLQIDKSDMFNATILRKNRLSSINLIRQIRCRSVSLNISAATLIQ